MGQLSQGNIQNWQVKRILSFLNRAHEPSDITDYVQDDPTKGGSSTIGKLVAQRLIDHRKKLRPIFYQGFSQLNGIEGFGQDKLADLAYTFRRTAADEFMHNLFQGVILDNWKVEHHDRVISDPGTYREITRDPDKLRSILKEMLSDLARERFKGNSLAPLAPYLLSNTYLEIYDNADAGQYAWALWFYRFDADNWFSFDKIREVVRHYLSTYWNEDIQLVLVKGFQGQPLWTSSVSDLPVTLNEAEQTISLWRAELFD